MKPPQPFAGMKSLVRNLSAPAEFTLVILICFVFAIAGSIEVVIRHFLQLPPRHFLHPQQILLWALSYQLLALALVSRLGRLRGWSFSSFGLRPSWKMTGLGLLLFAALAMVLKILALPSGIVDATGKPGPFLGPVTLPVVVLWCALNPFFEETIETGYLIQRLQRYGMWPAVWASACFRASLHAFFGLKGVALVLCLGLLFGLIYWRWRTLWPLLLAHAWLDFLLLFPLLPAA
jgi:membrane protease YdiL (CAAX protease family)